MLGFRNIQENLEKVKGQLPIIYSFFFTDKLSNVILGSSGLNELDKADEKFRNRRRELMEKAKSLEEVAAAAKAKKPLKRRPSEVS